MLCHEAIGYPSIVYAIYIYTYFRALIFSVHNADIRYSFVRNEEQTNIRYVVLH